MSTLHLISHTHWDREWYRTFQQFRLRLVRLVDYLLEILKNDPDYRYYMLDGQTIVLEDYLQIRPERRAELQEHILSGRILIGPWHVLADEFLVSPESLVRNLLQGARTCASFGTRMPIGYTPDPFGHIGQLPQLLRGFGIEAACLQRGLADEPVELWWQAPDGSRIFLAFLREGYGNGANLSYSDPERLADGLLLLDNSLSPFSATSQRLIMQGTDHIEPIPETSSAIQAVNGKLPGITLVHSTLPRYLEAVFEELKAHPVDLPVVYGELRSPKRSPLLPGVLSSRIWIKQRNQASQQLLEAWVEPFSTLATQLIASQSTHPDLSWTGRLSHPEDILHQAWHLLMENHPHDSICGCSIDQVHAEMLPRFDQVDQIGEELTVQNLQALSTFVDTHTSSPASALAAIIVFNPSAFVRTDGVSVDVQVTSSPGNVEVMDIDGHLVPSLAQGIAPVDIGRMTFTREEFISMFGLFKTGTLNEAAFHSVTFHRLGDTLHLEVEMKSTGAPDQVEIEQILAGLDSYLKDATITHYSMHLFSMSGQRIRLIAPGIPPLGHATFWVRSALKSQSINNGDSSDLRLENEYFVVEPDPSTGTLSVQDKKTGAYYSGLNHFIDGGDSGDEYNYNPPPLDRFYSPSVLGIRKLSNSLGKQLEIDLELRLPAGLTDDRQSRSSDLVTNPIRSRVTVYPGIPRIDIHTEVINNARDHRLQVHFPAPFHTDFGDYDGHYQVVHRPVALPTFDDSWIELPRVEHPEREFIDISSEEIGLMLANRGLPEAAVFDSEDGNSEIALTLLRCVGWLSRGDLQTRKGDAGPALETPGAQMLGAWQFDYSIIPHDHSWQIAWQQAEAFNRPLRAVSSALHPGSLPSVHSFVNVSPTVIRVTALKAAEDGNGFILRGFNYSNQPVEASIKLSIPFQQVSRVRMDESLIEPTSISPTGELLFHLNGNEIFTFRFA